MDRFAVASERFIDTFRTLYVHKDAIDENRVMPKRSTEIDRQSDLLKATNKTSGLACRRSIRN